MLDDFVWDMSTLLYNSRTRPRCRRPHDGFTFQSPATASAQG